jgi:hypothetical protein
VTCPDSTLPKGEFEYMGQLRRQDAKRIRPAARSATYKFLGRACVLTPGGTKLAIGRETQWLCSFRSGRRAPRAGAEKLVPDETGRDGKR